MSRFVSLFDIESLALIRGKERQGRTEFEVFVGISDAALEAKTELSAEVTIYRITLLVIGTGTYGLLEDRTQILVVVDQALIYRLIPVGRVITFRHPSLFGIALVPYVSGVRRRDTSGDRRDIDGEVRSVITLLPVNTDGDVGIGRREPFRDDVVISVFVVTSQGVLALERTEHGEIPVLLELPSEFGSEFDIIAGFLEGVFFLLNPSQSEVGIEIGFPSDSIFMIQEVEFGIRDAVDIVLTTGSPVHQPGSGGIESDGTVKFPCFLSLLQLLKVGTCFRSSIGITGHLRFVHFLSSHSKRGRQGQRKSKNFLLHTIQKRLFVIRLFVRFSQKTAQRYKKNLIHANK